MNTIIENVKLNNTALQLTLSKCHEGFSAYALGKKGNFEVHINAIELDSPEYKVNFSLIDIVDTEEEALVVLKKFQREFKKQTGISLRKKGILSSGYPMWTN